VSRATRITIVLLALGVVHNRAASAQSPGADAGRLEVAFGALWIGEQALGSMTATETTPTLGRLPLFTTTSTLGAAPAIEGRVGWRIARALTAEAEASYGQPDITIAIANDFEGAPATTASERVQQFTVGGALVWSLPIRIRRLEPFVTGGAGYLRQLHENATLVQTGGYYQVGGGVMVLLASHPDSFLKAMGLRVDARAVIRVDGVAFDSNAHTVPAAGASLFVRF
jgi:hypothetical protein